MNAQPPPNVMARSINDLVRSETATLVSELREGGDAAWNAPAFCKGWVAKDAVVHLIVGNGMFDAALDASLNGTPPAAPDPAQSEARVAGLNAQSREQLLAQLERQIVEYTNRFDALDAATLQRPVVLPFTTLPLWQFPGLRLNEAAIHHWDVRAGRFPDARITAGVVPYLVGMLVPAMPMLAGGEKVDGTWQLDVDTPTGGPLTLRVQNGTVQVERGPAPNPDVRLTLDGDAFIRLVWGRLDLAAAIDSGRVRIEGERERALALQRLFPGF